MKFFEIACASIIAIVVIVWLYRRAVITKKYVKTIGEIINFKNMVPLVNKTMVHRKGKYRYTECKYQGDVFVVVRFVGGDGNEMTRRFNASEPLCLKINEHKRTVTQYTAVFPEWGIGKRVTVYYDPNNTTDIFVGRTPPYHQAGKPPRDNYSNAS